MKWGVKNHLFHDVVLNVSGEKFVAHKVVLCARSAYFNALMTGGLKESAQREVVFPETNPEAFAIVLQYMYTKELDVDTVADQIVDVFALACQYGLKTLKSELETLIAYNLTEDNVSSLIVMADSQGAIKVCNTYSLREKPYKSFAAENRLRQVHLSACCRGPRLSRVHSTCGRHRSDHDCISRRGSSKGIATAGRVSKGGGETPSILGCLETRPSQQNG